MEERKQDLRIRKTKLSLSLAMFRLLETQGFGKISVNDICTEAMVSRSAFYMHFEDKYDLFAYCMDLYKKRLFEGSNELKLRCVIKNALERISEHSRVVLNIFEPEIDAEVMEIIRKNFLSDFQDLLKTHKIEEYSLPGPVEMISIYYASGIMSMVLYWIEKKMIYSTDEMTNCLFSLLQLDE